MNMRLLSATTILFSAVVLFPSIGLSQSSAAFEQGFTQQESSNNIAKTEYFVAQSIIRNPCPFGGSIAGDNCQLQAFGNGVVFPGVKYWVDANPKWPGIYYKGIQDKCPYGGTRAGVENCQLMKLNGKLTEGVRYWVDANPDWPGLYYRQPQKPQ
ncbi:exported hypothetical protein [Planktothrix sp. PCC 11201]|uniref:hypothetical protein n=1 Tax=Planktothrix sp. PCC 11201 TaxID=1729650 RepID=UPI0009104263|nr:hypothetical protein [Planktothrix sp. PCC 11201]SKB14310.1 exported hypothetical protein [Planktothrix sp. PCC 11201]